MNQSLTHSLKVIMDSTCMNGHEIARLQLISIGESGSKNRKRLYLRKQNHSKSKRYKNKKQRNALLQFVSRQHLNNTALIPSFSAIFRCILR